MPKAKKLTAKQQMFVKEYLVDLNATQAAIRAGYSPKTSGRIGDQNLKKLVIQEAIQTAMDERAARVDISADAVLRELGRIVFFNIKRVFNEDGTLKTITDLDDDVAAAIGSIEVVGKLEGEAVVNTTKIRLNDKNKAIDSAMRHLGLYNDKLKVESVPHEDALSELE